MDEATVKAFQEAVWRFTWRTDFDQFCAITGWKGTYAKEKWQALRRLNTALGEWDPATLATILSSTPEARP